MGDPATMMPTVVTGWARLLTSWFIVLASACGSTQRAQCPPSALDALREVRSLGRCVTRCPSARLELIDPTEDARVAVEIRGCDAQQSLLLLCDMSASPVECSEPPYDTPVSCEHRLGERTRPGPDRPP